MDPSERAWFWREVAEANRAMIVDREMAKLRTEFEATFSPPVLWMARQLGRAQAWLVKLRERAG
jgi:hypothetical protein